MTYELVKREDRYDLYNSEGHKIASTKGYPNVGYTLSVRNCEEIERGYDFDNFLDAELNKLPYTKHLDDGQFNDGQISGFELGARWAFQKAIELMGDKKFSEKDGKFLFECGRNYQVTGDTDCNFYNAIQSLQQTEWEVEIDMESNLHNGEMIDESYPKDFPIQKPKLSKYGFLILKRV